MMLALYTSEIGKYYTIEGITEDLDVIRKPFEIEVKPIEYHPLNDLFFDYLLTLREGSPLNDFFARADIESLEREGFDLDLAHYAIVRCPWLPFVHFIHLEKKWII